MVILRKRLGRMNEAALSSFILRAKRSVRLRGEITLLVTDGQELKRLNQRFRGKNRPTDVLSFPATRISRGALAGDIAIAADIACRNAQRLGHTPLEEIKILALHGLLHLAGYDHERDDGEMARRENHLRRLLRLPLGLIERHGRDRLITNSAKRPKSASNTTGSELGSARLGRRTFITKTRTTSTRRMSP